MVRQVAKKGPKVLFFGLFFFLLLFARSSWQQTPSAGPAYLVKDINTLPRSDAFNFEYADYGQFGDRYLIWMTDSEHGQEPWVTNGTAQGTYLLRDIYPGMISSWPGYYDYGKIFYASNGWAVFSARDEEHGVELWRTDGTPEGTLLLKDIGSGDWVDPYFGGWKGSSNPCSYFAARLNPEGEEKDLILFSAYSYEYGRELYITDGTPAGTQLLKDIYPGVDSSGAALASGPIAYLQYGGFVYFTTWNYFLKTHGLWRTDGREQGTSLIKSVGWGGVVGYPWEFMGNVFFASRETSDSPLQQWKVNQQTGEAELVGPSCYPSNAWQFRGFLIYWWNDGIHGLELWKSDGTASGSEMIKDIGSDQFYPTRRFLTVINDILYFLADDKIHGTELWRTDGTTEGTQLVVDLYPGSYGGLSDIEDFLELNGKMFFVKNRHELYASDGTANGTKLIWDGTIYFWAGGELMVRKMGRTETSVYFAGLNNAHGIELWKTDGTSQGTKLVEDIYRGEASSFPMIIGGFGETLLFTADDGEHGRELWRTDGTHLGTFMPKDACLKGSYSSNPMFFGGVGGELIFTAWDKQHGQELWKSNGTEAGTKLLRDICPGPDSGGWPNGGPNWKEQRPPTEYWHLSSTDGLAPTTPYQQDQSALEGPCLSNGEIFFAARNRNLQMELWKTNGTATTVVKDINTGREGSWPRYKINFKDQVYFMAYTEETGWELWKSDGNPAGTKIVKDINPGPGSSIPYYFVELGDWLYFRADDGVHGFELWRTDGTQSGTNLACDIVPGADSGFGWQTGSNYYYYGPQPVAEGGLFYFGANVPSQGGYELWRSDGTANGTFLVRDINPGSSGSSGQDFIGYNGKLIFSAYEPLHGWEVWITDGTEWGTTIVKDLWPGPGYGLSTWYSDYGPRFVRSGDWIYFVPYPNYGSQVHDLAGELWKTDGTEIGTQPVRDIYPGKDSYSWPYTSDPIQMADIDGVLVFSAEDGIHGRELWRSDGTPAGTYMIQDIYAEEDAASNGWLEQFTKLGNLVYFVAYDRRGYELWAMPIEAVGAMTPAQPTGKQ